MFLPKIPLLRDQTLGWANEMTWQGRLGGCGQMVTGLAFYSDDPSSILPGVYSFYSVICTQQIGAQDGPDLYVGLLRMFCTEEG